MKIETKHKGVSVWYHTENKSITSDKEGVVPVMHRWYSNKKREWIESPISYADLKAEDWSLVRDHLKVFAIERRKDTKRRSFGVSTSSDERGTREESYIEEVEEVHFLFYRDSPEVPNIRLYVGNEGMSIKEQWNAYVGIFGFIPAKFEDEVKQKLLSAGWQQVETIEEKPLS